MKPKEDAITREGLLETLVELGFSERLKGGSTRIFRRQNDDGNYIVCFLFPVEHQDPEKNSGFASIAVAYDGNAYDGSHLKIEYDQSQYNRLYKHITKKIEPIMGKIL